MSAQKWLLIFILTTSFLLNFWGIDWGLPERWHPDELIQRSEKMYQYRNPDHNYHARGSLSFYQNILLSIWPVDIWQGWFGWHPVEIKTMNTWWARYISVLMATSIVWLVYALGKKLFDRKSALITAGLMGVTMGLVNLAHFASTDISSLFWSMLAAYYAVKTWQEGSTKNYILAGVFSGMAAAVRFTGGILVLSLLMAHWLRKKEDRSQNKLILGVFASILAFIAGNASMIFSPCTFMVGFIKESFFDTMRNPEGSRAFAPLITEYINAAGWPIAVLSMAGLVFTVWLVWKPRFRKEILLIMSMLLPHYFVIGSMHVSNLRYALPLIPFVLLLVGKMLTVFFKQLPPFQKTIWQTILIGALIYSFIYVLIADLNFVNDSRNSFKNWLNENVNTNDSIEITTYVSDSSNSAQPLYNINYLPHDYGEWSTRIALQKSSLYNQTLNKAYIIEQWAKKHGFCPKSTPTYISWHEKATSDYQKETTLFDIGPQGLLDRQPDWIVISDIYYKRFLNGHNGKEAALFKKLLAGELPYTLVQELKYEGWPGFTPRVEFVNPRLLIFRKQKDMYLQ